MNEILPPTVLEILQLIHQAGGQGILVGGCVRDYVLKIPIKDFDIEVYGLSLATLEECLDPFGPLRTVGVSFGVLKLTECPTIDISLPRRDNKNAPGHRGFKIEVDPSLDFATAARRRDLTVNSVGYDAISQFWLDPFKGLDDIQHRILRATDPLHFAEDPLRGLRVARFAGQLNMQPTPELLTLCQQLDLSELSRERVATELKRMLTTSHPQHGFNILRTTHMARFIPGIKEWSSDAWDHACNLVAQPVGLGVALPCRVANLIALGESPGKQFLKSLMLDHAAVKAIYHMGTTLHRNCSVLLAQDASQYRLLARELGTYGLHLAILIAAAQLWQPHHAWTECQRYAKDVGVLYAPLPPAVTGQDLIKRGIPAGPELGHLLKACLVYQDTHGITDPTVIMEKVLA